MYRNGLTLAKGYDCKIYPDAFYGLIKENEYIRNKIEYSNKIEYELKLMHQIRLWEQEAYSGTELDKIVELTKKEGFSFELLDELIEKYGRFKK